MFVDQLVVQQRRRQKQEGGCLQKAKAVWGSSSRGQHAVRRQMVVICKKNMVDVDRSVRIGQTKGGGGGVGDCRAPWDSGTGDG